MTQPTPPTIDPQAAQRWAHRVGAAAPWLHEEVARRMQERLQWIRLQPQSWLHWGPLRGGLQAHRLIEQRYPAASVFLVESTAAQEQLAVRSTTGRWWRPTRWRRPATRAGMPDEPVQMLWANMSLHMAADPQALIACWHRAVAVDGFLMFSCLGPDTLRELRGLYAARGWPPPSHVFTDMHDWGDMLVQAGFAEPVMDMERVVLTFETPQRLLQELRELGRNLHPARAAGLRGKGWLHQLHLALGELAQPDPQGRLALTFEVIYGHAFKPAPRLPVQQESVIALDQLRQTLRAGVRRS